jgi:hypothetical protein
MSVPNDRPRGAKFIQVCASQNDLFALDEEGDVHQYNFTAKTWERLVGSRTQQSPERGDRKTRGGGTRAGGA